MDGARQKKNGGLEMFIKLSLVCNWRKKDCPVFIIRVIQRKETPHTELLWIQPHQGRFGNLQH